MTAASILDYRELARRRLPPFLFEYMDGGSYAEVTLRRNIADLENVALRQHVLRDVSSIDLSTELFGQKLALPLALAPIGLAGMNARQRRGSGRARRRDLPGSPSRCRPFRLVHWMKYAPQRSSQSGSSFI